MALNLSIPEQTDLRPRITVFGVGGAGGNAVNNMIEKNLEGADFVVANTDAQALQQSQAPSKLQLGELVTEGLGAGARPEVGSAAAEESIEAIVDQLVGAHMCFITAGMGGGTGTGAAPIIAKAAREMGVLTVGVVTKPFQFEGSKRMRQAEEGIEELQRVVDTLIIIPNQNLFRLANEKTTFTEAFALADDVLYQGVKGVTDLMVRPGIINLDFADVRSVMDEMGKAMMGTGEAEGEDRAIQAAERAINNPLLDEISLKGARGVLINVTGGEDLTLFELDEAANRIRGEVDPDANIIVGSTLDASMAGVLRVSVVATGIDVMEGEEADRTTMRHGAPVVSATSRPAPAEVPVEAVAASAEVPEGPSFVDARPVEVEPQPVAEQPQQQVAEYHETEAPQAAPEMVERAPRAGEPTPQALQRLQAAVAKVPAAPVPEAPQHAPRAHDEEQGRFAINNLIHRMTGQGGAPREERAAQTPRTDTPPMTARREPADQADARDRNDIPAFLRRQAN